jgi:hypothetical protein
MFNSLKYVKELEAAGTPPPQAEAYVKILSEMMESNLATKEDLSKLDVKLQHAMELLRKDVRYEIQKMTIKLGTIVSVAIGVAVTLSKLVA